MNIRTTFFLLVLVGAVGSYIYFLERNTDTTEQRVAKSLRAFHFDPDEVTGIGVEFGDFKCRFVQKDKVWYMETPAGALADAAAVKRLLNELEKMEHSELIRAASVAEYGAAQPQARFSILAGEENTLYEVGNLSPIGDQVYVWVANSKDVISIPSTFLDVLPKSMSDVRDHRLFLAKPDNITKIELKRPEGFVQIERRENNLWWLTQPVQTRADLAAIKYLTDRFYTARIEKFITDEKTELAIYGFGDDSSHVRLWSDLDEFPVKLILGGPLEDNPKMNYARIEGVDSVFAVSAGVDGLLKYEMAGLRERRLLTLSLDQIRAIRLEDGDRVIAMNRNEDDAWQISQPQIWKTMESRIGTLVEQWTASRVGRFVDLPVNPIDDSARGKKLYSITFSESDTISIAPSGDGAENKSGPDFYYEVYEKDYGRNKVLVHSVPDNSWCEVVPGMVKYINLDPLYYRDHEVMGIQPDEILRVSVTMGVQTSSVSREAIGEAWTVEQPGHVLNDVRLNDCLTLCEKLEAKALIELNPADLTRFDLDKPSYAITFGLTGASGISRTLLLGRTLDDGSVYGMIRGKDLVFTLPDSARKILMNEICMPEIPKNEIPPENGKEAKSNDAQVDQANGE